MKCPCCSGTLYSECCKKFHEGACPQTALELMRSRYSAYALKNAEYIMKTTHPLSPSFEKDQDSWTKAILEFCAQSSFEKLEILKFGENWVHFKAYLGHGVLEEKSTFEKLDEKWLYLNGELKFVQGP